MRVTSPPGSPPIAYETVFVDKPETVQKINSLELECQDLKIKLMESSTKYVEKIVEKVIEKDPELLNKYNDVVKELSKLRNQPRDIKVEERIVEKIIEIPIHIEKIISKIDVDFTKKCCAISAFAAWIIGLMIGAWLR